MAMIWLYISHIHGKTLGKSEKIILSRLPGMTSNMQLEKSREKEIPSQGLSWIGFGGVKFLMGFTPKEGGGGGR